MSNFPCLRTNIYKTYIIKVVSFVALILVTHVEHVNDEYSTIKMDSSRISSKKLVYAFTTLWIKWHLINVFGRKVLWLNHNIKIFKVMLIEFPVPKHLYKRNSNYLFCNKKSMRLSEISKAACCSFIYESEFAINLVLWKKTTLTFSAVSAQWWCVLLEHEVFSANFPTIHFLLTLITFT